MPMKTFLRLVWVLVGLALAAAPAHAGDITVKDAMAAPSPTPQSITGAVYFSVINQGDKPDHLLEISTPAATDAMIHESKDENGVMKMNMVDALEIPAGATVELKPGHMHLMLTGLKKPLVTGDHIKLNLQFEKAGLMSIDVLVGKVN